MNRLIAALGAAGLVATGALLLGGTASAAAADTATVSVVHGIPDTPVNVFVNGKATLTDFKPLTVAGPLELPAGTYDVKVYPAKDTAGSGTPVIEASATLTAGENVTLVAHLTADGKPTITPYVNDTSAIEAGKGRLVVRHDAAAPAVDVRANGTVAFPGLVNPKEASADLPAGTVSADVVLAGTSTVAIGPADVTVTEGTETIVYAVGSASDKTLGVVVQTIDGLGSAPGGVPAGTGGQSAGLYSQPGWIAAVIGLGVVIAAAGMFTVRSGRRRAIER
jgi:hypothetical protein